MLRGWLLPGWGSGDQGRDTALRRSCPGARDGAGTAEQGLAPGPAAQTGATARQHGQGKNRPFPATAMGFLALCKRGLPEPQPQVGGSSSGTRVQGQGCQHLSAASDESARPQPHNLYSLIRRAGAPAQPCGAHRGGGAGRPIPPAGRGLEVMKFVNGECLRLEQSSRGAGTAGAAEPRAAGLPHSIAPPAQPCLAASLWKTMQTRAGERRQPVMSYDLFHLLPA